MLAPRFGCTLPPRVLCWLLVYVSAGSQPVQLYFSNPDLVWATDYPRPRFGQGAFSAMLQAVHSRLAGGQGGAPMAAVVNTWTQQGSEHDRTSCVLLWMVQQTGCQACMSSHLLVMHLAWLLCCMVLADQG